MYSTLTMPTNYVDMDADELCFDGGAKWLEYLGLTLAIAGAIAVFVGCGYCLAGAHIKGAIIASAGLATVVVGVGIEELSS